MAGLTKYFVQEKEEKMIYMVTSGNKPGIYSSWSEVLKYNYHPGVQPLCKKYTTIGEAKDAAHRHFKGHSFFVSPAIKNQFDNPPPQEASSSTSTCSNCKTYRSQLAEVSGQIDNKDEQILALHEQVMMLEAQINTLKTAPQQQQQAVNLMQQPKPMLQVKEEVVRSKQIEFSLIKIEQQTSDILHRVKVFPYMQDQVLRQYIHRRYDLSDNDLKEMRNLIDLPEDDLPPIDKDQTENNEAGGETPNPIYEDGSFTLNKEDFVPATAGKASSSSAPKKDWYTQVQEEEQEIIKEVSKATKM
jgi:hypothetical protein